MEMKYKAASVAAALVLTASLATTSTAKEVDAALAANPTATISTIDAMGLASLSNLAAMEVRGGELTLNTPLPPPGTLARLRYPACMAALRASGRILPMCVGLY